MVMNLNKLWEIEDRGVWCAVVHGVAKSQTRLSDGTTNGNYKCKCQGVNCFLFYFLSFMVLFLFVLFFFLVNSNTYIIKDISENKRIVAEHAGLYSQPLSPCWQEGGARITTPTF